jgi:outer membrane protein OmpA-like peptidoglycan-associated protein
MRRLAFAAAAAALVAGCASTSRVTLLPDEGVATAGAVAAFDPKTDAEVGELTAPNTQAVVGGRSFRPVATRPDAYAGLLSVMPYPPRVYVLYFTEGTTDLTAESKPILEALRKAVSPGAEVQIVGHTDTVGSSQDNDELSRDRAVEIRAALVRQGLPLENARVTGRGEREPRVPTADNVSEPANRRVEVILR